MTLLPLNPVVMKFRGPMILDLVMCKTILAGSGLIMARYFLKMMQLATNLGIEFPFWGVLIYFAPLW